MKRTPELRTLSEDHHHGLVHARRLRRAAEEHETTSAVSVATGFLDFWQKDTALHFRKEEEVLLPVMARYEADLSRQPLLEMFESRSAGSKQTSLWIRLTRRLSDRKRQAQPRTGSELSEL